MLARVATFALSALDPVRVTAEVDVRPGLPAFTLVGLGDVAVRESRERVRSALLNSGFDFPLRRIVANLAPASLKKAGPAFDAALAAALLAASEQVPVGSLDGVAVFAELSLGGELRGCRGTLAAAEGARASGIELLLVAEERAGEAALVTGLKVGAIRDLQELAAVLSGNAEVRLARPTIETATVDSGLDLADVRGQPHASRALEIAAAGSHNLLMEGPPGVGKTMLARRLPGLIPPLAGDEALEVTRIQSVAGLFDGGGLVRQRPFRAPHHTVSPAGLVGGGSVPMPGEVTLAHRGVLFLDELSEFPRHSLDALRQPLEDGSVTVVRRSGAATFPARCTLVAATNPCPCGYAGQGSRCHCDQQAIDRHQRRLSGPLVDRLDLLVALANPTGDQLRSSSSTSTAEVAGRVVAAHAQRNLRWSQSTIRSNAEAPEASLTDQRCLSKEALEAVDAAYARGLVGLRGRVRVLRVARTIADLREAGLTGVEDVLEALSMRLRVDGGTQ